jgi:PAS domain S-box-containing protein
MSKEVRRAALHPHEYYEEISRTVRWFMLALVLITYPLAGPNAIIIHTLLGFAAVYNLLRYDDKLRRFSFFSAPYHSMAIDHILVLALVTFTGGLASPYYLLFLPLILAAIATYGIAGFTYVLGGQVVIALLLLKVADAPTPSTPELQFIVKIIIIVIFTLIAEQTVRSRNEEYLLEGQFVSEAETERHRLRALINSLSTAFMAVDRYGKIYLFNQAAAEIISTPGEITGRVLGEILPLHDRRGRKFNLLEAVAPDSDLLARQDLKYRASDGSVMTLDITVTPVRATQHDQAGGYLVMLKDITKEKSLTEQRDEFIAVISHELRTPLAILEANLSTTLLPGFTHLEPKAKLLLEQSHKNAVFLTELIENLTTISRAEREDLDVEMELVSATDLATDLARDYRPQAEAKHLKLNLEIGADVGSIITDAAQLREILQNFLTNAIKYSSAGAVTLAVNRLETGTEFSVQDNGIGISASDKNKIFNKFYRSEDYRTRQTGGTGLGLYLCQKLADKLGIELTFTSRLNHGSIFKVVVPVRHDHAADLAISAAARTAA